MPPAIRLVRISSHSVSFLQYLRPRGGMPYWSSSVSPSPVICVVVRASCPSLSSSVSSVNSLTAFCTVMSMIMAVTTKHWRPVKNRPSQTYQR